MTTDVIKQIRRATRRRFTAGNPVLDRELHGNKTSDGLL